VGDKVLTFPVNFHIPPYPRFVLIYIGNNGNS